MKINNVHNRNAQSFQALTTRIQSKPGTVMFDGIRHALLPDADELVSKLSAFANNPHRNNQLEFAENGQLHIRLSRDVSDKMGQAKGASIDKDAEIMPTEGESAEAFGERLKVKLVELYNQTKEFRPGGHIT